MEASLNLILPRLLRWHCIGFCSNDNLNGSECLTDYCRVGRWGLERGCCPTQLYVAVYSDSVCLWHVWIHGEHCPLSETLYVSAYVVDSDYLKSTDGFRQDWEGTGCGLRWRTSLVPAGRNGWEPWKAQSVYPSFHTEIRTGSVVNNSETLTFCSRLSNANHIQLLFLILSWFSDCRRGLDW
jgi:hypothetical protein